MQGKRQFYISPSVPTQYFPVNRVKFRQCGRVQGKCNKKSQPLKGRPASGGCGPTVLLFYRMLLCRFVEVRVKYREGAEEHDGNNVLNPFDMGIEV